MQPTFRQVPPKAPDSTSATRWSRNSRPRMVLPEPEPTTTRSTCMGPGYDGRAGRQPAGPARPSVGKDRGDDRPGQGVEDQVERDHGGAGAVVRTQLGHVDRVHHEEVPVHL